ncbi:MAG: histidine triad nucleotide-binding protein [Acidobacteriota bacterium]|jgi:histidine triad (HIT) family protein|nr:histidine triad nucleotide-binding protein [Acidobacteriota bacterium]
MQPCIFCRIVEGAIPTPFVYKDDEIVAFSDIQPQAPVHLLVVPRRHVGSLNEADDDMLLGRLLASARKAAAQAGLEQYRIVVNTGADAGQSVLHLHLHVLGGRVMAWPPG